MTESHAMTLAEMRDKGEREHFETQEMLVQRIGLTRLIPLVPFTRQQIVDALASGDVHLNTLRMVGDRAFKPKPEYANFKGFRQACWDMSEPETRALARNSGIKGWSLSDNVCILKHVARYYIAV